MFVACRVSLLSRNHGRNHGCSRGRDNEHRLGCNPSPSPRRSPSSSRSLSRRLSRATWRCVGRRLLRIALFGAVALAAFGTAGIGAAVLVGARLGTRRVVVEGRSMLPTFEPGDRLLVVRIPRRWPLRCGDVVAVPDPRMPDRLLVKRVEGVSSGLVTVAGDNASESTDSRSFGPVDRAQVWGRACYRYAPRERSGWVCRRTSGA